MLVQALTSTTRAQEPGATNDMWDVSRGCVVTFHTGTIGQSNPSNMFGRVSSVAADVGINTLFRDDVAAGFVHAIEWQIPNPIRLKGYVLHAFHDDDTPSCDRAFSSFRLFAYNPATLTFDLIDQFNPSVPYLTTEFNRTIPPRIAQKFRAEFVQHTCCHFAGPRVQELDSIEDVETEGVVFWAY